VAVWHRRIEMDWGSISTLVAEVLFGGGLLVFVTIKDKKTAAILDNMQTVIAEQKELAKAYKEEAESYKTEIAEYRADAKAQEIYIQDLHKSNSELYVKLDKANSRAAVNKLLKCSEIGCSKRRPPLGEGAADTFKQIRNENLGDGE
jgi:F0F1-type ATP synthase membrane subunit b/b'